MSPPWWPRIVGPGLNKQDWECHPKLHSQTPCQTPNGNNQVITIDKDVGLTNLSYMSKNSKQVLQIRFIKLTTPALLELYKKPVSSLTVSL